MAVDLSREPNIEGIVAELLTTFPFEDPGACREIHRLLGLSMEASLANRAARHGPTLAVVQVPELKSGKKKAAAKKARKKKKKNR